MTRRYNSAYLVGHLAAAKTVLMLNGLTSTEGFEERVIFMREALLELADLPNQPQVMNSLSEVLIGSLERGWGLSK